MQHLNFASSLPLFDSAATRRIEQAALAASPPHALMQRAGLAVAQLALALAPHSRTIWIACGPGNNGGDGLEAAMHLARWGKQVVVGWLGDAHKTPADALASLQRARAAGVRFSERPPELAAADLGIDALLGLGSTRPPEGRMLEWIVALNSMGAPVLAIDLPTGLNADSGVITASSLAGAVRAQHTLSLLTLKPGLFTGNGRDCAGQVWFDDLGLTHDAANATIKPSAWLSGAPVATARTHASHKGSYGDVAVIGGARGMTGAALLAARAALHHGAGRVFVALLQMPEGAGPAFDASQPELMFREPTALVLQATTVACGCGGGSAIQAVLPQVLIDAAKLVLDADALNAIAADAALQAALAARSVRGQPTVLTPHPLEAARLLGCSVAEVQADRLEAARGLAERFACVVVLKGSGSVIAAPGESPRINPTGNARLATAGTGDVLAGMVAARLAGGEPAFAAGCDAVYRHGWSADQWPEDHALTAGLLARAAFRREGAKPS